MKAVRLINFHCIVKWGTIPEELINYEFVKQIRKGESWANLVILRERRLNPQLWMSFYE